MLEFFVEPANSPFSIAIMVMFGIAILEGICLVLGFGIFQFLDTLLPELELNTEIDISVDMESPSALSRFFSWLRIGKVPILMLLVVLLTSFGLIGLTIQSFVVSITGHLIPGWLASIPALLLAFPVVSVSGKILEKIMPGDETDAVSEDSLVGRVATITIGTAKSGSPAEARVQDQHGTTHYVMVEPDLADSEFPSGSQILLIRNEGARFVAITASNSSLID